MFKPKFDLYDGDTFVRAVDADFVVWEIHGRDDFTYSSTMEEAGCVKEAQTWHQMRLFTIIASSSYYANCIFEKC